MRINNKNLKPNEVDLVIYHNNCSDGFAARVLIEDYMTKNFPNRQVEYYPASHYTEPPDVNGKNVLCCDFAYNLKITNELISKSNKFLILDHHLTSMQELKKLSNKYKHFDLNESGASLVWYYYYPNKKLSLMYEYIKARDLWIDIPMIKEFASWFFSFGFDYHHYTKYMTNNDLFKKDLELYGPQYLKEDENFIKSQIRNSKMILHKYDNKYLFVVYCESYKLKSDIGNSLIENEYYKYADFACIVDYKKNCSIFSLRSTNENYNCSEIAKYLGGGGHRNASGIKLNSRMNYLPLNIVLNNDMYKSFLNIKSTSITINNNKYNIVIGCLNYDFQNVTAFGTFLLQEKYKKNNEIVQECSDLFMKRDKLNNRKYNIAITYCHLPNVNKMHVKLNFKYLTLAEIYKIKGFLNFNNDNNMYIDLNKKNKKIENKLIYLLKVY